MQFEQFLKTVKENRWELYGIEVFHKGEIIHKYERAEEKPHPIYSATKTITATAAGLAAGEGRFSVDASVYDYFKDEIPSFLTSAQTEKWKRITIKRLLTMSVPGFPFRPQGEDWLEFSLSCPLEDVETPAFAYSNIPAYLVGAAVEKAVGQHLISYLKPRLFGPLGIENPAYMNCPSGHFYGASGMELTVHELSKIGQLYLQNGYYDGHTVLSSAWVREATKIQQMNQEGGYGYFIWKYKDGYRISGKWGQRCFVFPERQMMITYLSHMEHGSGAVAEAMEDCLLQSG